MNWDNFDWPSFWLGAIIIALLLAFTAALTGIFLP
jgi:hypothetical protein